MVWLLENWPMVVGWTIGILSICVTIILTSLAMVNRISFRVGEYAGIFNTKITSIEGEVGHIRESMKEHHREVRDDIQDVHRRIDRMNDRRRKGDPNLVFEG